MSQLKAEDTAAVPSPDADAVIDRSMDLLLDLGLPRDSKLGEKIRPLAREMLMELEPRGAAGRVNATDFLESTCIHGELSLESFI